MIYSNKKEYAMRRQKHPVKLNTEEKSQLESVISEADTAAAKFNERRG
jgi:hypothetical protein